MEPKIGGVARAYALALAAGLPEDAVGRDEQSFKASLGRLAQASGKDRVLLAAIRALEKHVSERGLDSVRTATQGVKAAERVATLAPKMKAGAWSSPAPRVNVPSNAQRPEYARADGVAAYTPMMALGLESAAHAGRTWQQRAYFNFLPGVEGARVKPVLMDTLRTLNERLAGPFAIPEEIQFTVKANSVEFGLDVLLDNVGVDLGGPDDAFDPNDPAFDQHLRSAVAHEYGHALFSLNLSAVADRLCPDGALVKALAVEEACMGILRPDSLAGKMNEVAKQNQRGYEKGLLGDHDLDLRHAQLRAVDQASQASFAAGMEIRTKNLRSVDLEIDRGATPLEVLLLVTAPYHELFADACAVACTNNLECNAEAPRYFMGESPLAEELAARSFAPRAPEDERWDEPWTADSPHELFAPARRYLGSLFLEYNSVADRTMILKALLRAVALDLESLVSQYEYGNNPLFRQDRHGRLAMDCGDVMPRNRALIDRVKEQLGKRA